jgi:hypothetical protein
MQHMFTLNHSYSELVPEGQYEIIIQKAEQKETVSGKRYLGIDLAVRNDIEQPQKNRHIFHSIWQKREPNAADKAFDGYSAAQINTLSRVAGLQNGKKYSNILEWLSDLPGKPALITVRHEVYNGNANARVGALNPTAHTNVCHAWESSAVLSLENDFSFVDLNDDEDLPF